MKVYRMYRLWFRDVELIFTSKDLDKVIDFWKSMPNLLADECKVDVLSRFVS